MDIKVYLFRIFYLEMEIVLAVEVVVHIIPSIIDK